MLVEQPDDKTEGEYLATMRVPGQHQIDALIRNFPQAFGSMIKQHGKFVLVNLELFQHLRQVLTLEVVIYADNLYSFKLDHLIPQDGESGFFQELH